MEISVLQSLIDRTSNQIAGYEACISFERMHQKIGDIPPWELDQSNFTISFYKQRLPKLRKIQKALKKEIAKSIEKAAQQRFYDSM